METVDVKVPAELLRVAGLDSGDMPAETIRLLALELYREGKVSLGRAAELCRTPVEAFLNFASRHEVSLSYDSDDLEEDRRAIERLGL
jgi:predicted HTH domain antitoxin